jgi:hypothetical protein
MQLVDDAKSSQSRWGVFQSPVARLILLAGIGVHILGIGLFLRSLQPPPAPAGPPETFLAALPPREGPVGGMLAEQALLGDSEPLFLPTRWNAGTPPPSAGPPLLEMPKPFGMPESELSLESMAVFTAPARADPELSGDAAAPARTLAFWDHFDGLGRAEKRPPALPRRSGYLRVEEAGTGRVVARAPLARFPGEAFPDKLWSPARFMVLLSDAGVGARPQLVESSGEAEVDERLRALVRDYVVRLALAEGYYAVTVGP